MSLRRKQAIGHASWLSSGHVDSCGLAVDRRKLSKTCGSRVGSDRVGVGSDRDVAQGSLVDGSGRVSGSV